MIMATEKHPPLWLYGGTKPATDDFKRDGRCNCINQPDVFFSDDLSDKVIAKKMCAECAMLHPCTRWTLENYDRQTEGIFAGMDSDQRRRIANGQERYTDWSKEFNFTQRLARAAARQRDRRGIRKRDRRQAEMPCCPGCGSNQYVVREGRDKTVNRQQYQCTACGPYFLGEEL